MRHVHEQQRADLVADRPETRKVEMPAVGGETGNHHLRPHRQGLRLQRVVVDQAGGGIDAVLLGMVELA